MEKSISAIKKHTYQYAIGAVMTKTLKQHVVWLLLNEKALYTITSVIQGKAQVYLCSRLKSRMKVDNQGFRYEITCMVMESL